MADLFAYLRWRGDLPFTQVGLNCVDSLVLSTLCYIRFDGLVPEDLSRPVSLPDAAEAFLALPGQERRVRSRFDPELLRAAAQTARFRDVQLAFYRNLFLPEEQTQFASVACLLPDGSAYLAFRGTDATLVGWKENFNMSFQDFVPAQQQAARYASDFAAVCSAPLWLGGHSKGGNLAVFAAAKCAPAVQSRIRRVFNNDGPGFAEYLLNDPGYLAIVPKIRTFIPESSIIGLLLERGEDYRVIKSRQTGLMQHDPYSWEILAGDFIDGEDISPETRFVDQTIRRWLHDMSREERSRLVDAVYDLVSASGAYKVSELRQPKNVVSFFRALNADERVRKMVTAELRDLLRSAFASLPKSQKQP